MVTAAPGSLEDDTLVVSEWILKEKGILARLEDLWAASASGSPSDSSPNLPDDEFFEKQDDTLEDSYDHFINNGQG